MLLHKSGEAEESYFIGRNFLIFVGKNVGARAGNPRPDSFILVLGNGDGMCVAETDEAGESRARAGEAQT